jgi:hypothetical protein
MAVCPNCGRRAQRTKDWVCEWCGYPLLYGGFKTIDKTYKELQEERGLSVKSVEPAQENEEEFEYQAEAADEPESEPEPKKEPLWKIKKAPKPTYQPRSEQKPELREAIPPQFEPPPRQAPRPSAPMKPEEVMRFGTEPQTQPRYEPAPQPRQEIAPPTPPALFPKSRPEPVQLSRPEPMPPLQRPAAPLRQEPPPRMEPPPPPPPPKEEAVVVPSLDSIKDGTQLTIDQIDALFRADNVGASTAMKDKTLIIKGIVNKVFIRDHLDIRYLVVTGARKVIWSARCQFEKESVGAMSRLSEGQAVALRGKYDGYGKNIIFKNCELVASN